MQNPPKLVVFSDLDGTLLDHDTYRWDAAKPALERLAALGMPVVLASSKTAGEVEILQDQMGLSGQPAIVENGAGMIGLAGVEKAETYAALREALDGIAPELRQSFRGFGDMSVADLTDATGLPPDMGRLAKARGYSEPGIWSASDREIEHFMMALSACGITAQRGGRFLTLSFGGTKADAMDAVIKALRPDLTLALGDAPNDRTMLQKADMGVIVANPHRPPLPPLCGEEDGRITRTQGVGPVGWNAAVMAILDTLGSAEGHRRNG
ncbi:MAG: HAD-IIB family hydrolase [Pelagibaca sp.]